MKKFFYIASLMVVLTNAQAYNVGDVVDDETLSSLKIKDSKIAVVDFFASWCISCKKELPLINKIAPQLKSESVDIVGVCTDEDKEEGVAFQKELSLTIPVFNDTKQQMVEKFNPEGMPAIYYIKDKKVVKILFGAVDDIDAVVKNDIKGLK